MKVLQNRKKNIENEYIKLQDNHSERNKLKGDLKL